MHSKFSKVATSTIAQLLILFFAIISLPLEAEEQLPSSVKMQLLTGQFSAAAENLENLSVQGNNEAKYQLAILLLEGKGVRKSVGEAEKLLLQASKFQPNAAFLLGSLYAKGKQLPKNIPLAKRYLSIASESGNSRAENLLAEMQASRNNSNRVKPQTQRLFELAVSSGNLSLVIKQYLNGANLNHPNDKGNPPLITAILLNRKNVTNWLLKQKIDYSQRDDEGNSPLHIAAKLGKVGPMIAIETHTHDVDLLNKRKQTPLMLAISKKRSSAAQWLINKGANISLRDSQNKTASDYNKLSRLSVVWQKKNGTSNTNKARLSKKNRDYRIKALSRQSQDKKSPYYRWPVIAIAVSQSQVDLVKYLMDMGKSPLENTPKNDTALGISIETDQKDIQDLILNRYSLKTITSPAILSHLFFSSVAKDNTSLAEKILAQANKQGINDLANKGMKEAVINQNLASVKWLFKLTKQSHRQNLLHLSISDKEFGVTQFLINKSFDVNAVNSKGDTPLITAAKKQNPQAITLLLDAKADLNAVDPQGLSAVMWSVKKDCLKCVEILLNHRASIKQLSRVGNNATMLATKGKVAILSTLLTRENDLSIRNNNQLTALMMAINNDCVKCVALLLEHGAKPGRKNTSGRDAFDLAEKKPNILMLLEEN